MRLLWRPTATLIYMRKTTVASKPISGNTALLCSSKACILSSHRAYSQCKRKYAVCFNLGRAQGKNRQLPLTPPPPTPQNKARAISDFTSICSFLPSILGSKLGRGRPLMTTYLRFIGFAKNDVFSTIHVRARQTPSPHPCIRHA